MRDYVDDGVLLVNAFCQKSLVYAAHIEITKISNIIVNLLTIEK